MNRRKVKLVLLSILAVGAIGSVTVRGVYGALSAEETNHGGTLSTGTLTMDNFNFAAGAGTSSTTLSAKLGKTTVTSAAATTLSAGITTTTQTAISVSSAAGFPASGNYTILVDSEQMTVTGGQGTTTWTVTRGVNGTTAATHASGAAVTLAVAVPETTLNGSITAAQNTITVASAVGFPTSGNFTIVVDQEQMTVTGGQGTTTWTVTRGVNGTTAATHASGADVDPTTITVSSAGAFPTSGTFQIQIDNEVMTVTAMAGTTWTVTRGASGTVTTSHATGATVYQKTAFVASGTGFPTSGDFTVAIGAEDLLVTGVSGTTWTVDRGVDGTGASSHAAAATVTSHDCTSYTTTTNVNAACDAVVTFAPDAENYPGTALTTNVAITDSGSLPFSDLEVYMPSCLRDITPDAPFAANLPSISSLNGAATTGGFLVGGQTYYYELTAVLPSGETVAGPEAAYTPPTGTSTNTITLNWTAIPNATGYHVYRSTSEGGEQLLASVAGGSTVTYTDNSSTTPSGSPPAGIGSGNPCQSGNAQITIQETNSGGTNTTCWYPTGLGANCSFSGSFDLGTLAQFYDKLSSAIDLGSGPTTLGTRYFRIGLQFPSTASNALQGTAADFTLHWYALS